MAFRPEIDSAADLGPNAAKRGNEIYIRCRFYGGPGWDGTGDFFPAIAPIISISTAYKTPVAPEVLVSRCITENQHIAKRIALPFSTRTNGGILTKFITSFR